MINLAKAIGRIVISYKEVQQLAGFTTLVYEMHEVLEDLRKGKYIRTQINAGQGGELKLDQLNDMKIGKLIEV